MNRRRALAALAVAIVAVAAAAGCGGTNDTSAAPAAAETASQPAQETAPAEETAPADETSGAEKTYTIGWVPPTVAPFEDALRKGIQKQAESLGMEVVVAGGEFDPSVQITAVDSLVQRGVDAILIWPLDEKGIQPAFDRAREAGIPIFVIDSPGAKPYAANFQTNDYDTTYKLAQYAAEQTGSPCTVAIIQGVPVVPILKARNEGYAAGAEASGCEILDQQVNTNDNVETARSIVGTWKTKFGSDLKAILAVNDPSALAALSASGGDFDPVITGLNGDAENIQKIKDGQLAATAALLSPEIGNGMAYAAYQVLTGNEVPEEISVPYEILTSENIDSYQPYEARLQGPMTVEFVAEDGGYVLQASVG